jgi:putative FmdB family regulatory protein
MPLYEYKCEKCGFEFEELIFDKGNSSTTICKRCGVKANRKMSSFSSIVPNSPNESVDVKIGKEANDRWQLYYDRQKKRRAGKELKEMELPKVNGGYQPVMSLGTENEKRNRNSYSEILRRHKKERVERGQPQFSGTGSF